MSLLDYSSAADIVKDAFIPKKSVGFDFLNDVLPMVKQVYQKKRSQMENIPATQEVAPTINLSQNNQSVQRMQRVGSGPMYELIKKYFPKEEWDRAYNVMLGESGGRPDAVGDNYPIRGQTIPSYGLFQIRALPGRPAPEQLTDPEFNVQYAANMWKSQGWKPWTAARKLGYI